MLALIPSTTCVCSQPQSNASFEGENDATTISPCFQLLSAGRQNSHRDLNQHPPALPPDMNVCQGKEQRVDNCRYQRRLLVRLRTLNPVRWVGSRTSAVRAFDDENDEAYIHLNLNLVAS